MQKFPNAYVITGSIASGKSTVVNLLKERGFSVIDADLIAHEQLEICKCEIVKTFGEQILDEAGKIDRKKLGAIVFNGPKKLKNLEQILASLDESAQKVLGRFILSISLCFLKKRSATASLKM